jgi:hypothetical protein
LASLGVGYEYFFPENGAFPIPLVGAVGIGVPLTPRVAFVATQQEEFPKEELADMNEYGLLASLSLGAEQSVQESGATTELAFGYQGGGGGARKTNPFNP